jgi:tetratricopeptide (TPR) repeat protein
MQPLAASPRPGRWAAAIVALTICWLLGAAAATARGQPGVRGDTTAAATPARGAGVEATGWRELKDPRERFARANRSYQDGRFVEAVAIYDSILEDGRESPALYLNLGNALLRAGELGEAIVAYRRGLKLSPRDRDLRANLRYAESFSVDVVPDDSSSMFLEWLAGLVRRVSAAEALHVAAALYWLAVAVFLLGRLRPRWRRASGVAMWVLLPVLGLTAGLAAERAYAVWGRSEAIVLVEAIPVRTGPAEDYSVRFNLHEGTAVVIRRSADEWLEVELTDELSGWVPAGTLAPI